MFCRLYNSSSQRRLAGRVLLRHFASSSPTAAATEQPSDQVNDSLATNTSTTNMTTTKQQYWGNNNNNHNKSRDKRRGPPPPPKREKGKAPSPKKRLPPLELKDEQLPCAQHLDPEGRILPTSDWIHVSGTLPICSLREVVDSFESWLRKEEERGIVDLEALWNPVQDDKVPTLTLGVGDDDELSTSIQAAHAVISPFGRPNGWHLKLSNRSLVNAILTRAQEEHMRVAWKLVQVEEYEYSKEKEELEDPAYANGLVVDDSMVRFENCPPDLTDEYLRYLLSRFDLAPQGKTVIEWRGRTTDGKRAPLMFVVRFASAAWARAAVRELQSMQIGGKHSRDNQSMQNGRIQSREPPLSVQIGRKSIKLSAYPNQIRYVDEDEEETSSSSSEN